MTTKNRIQTAVILAAGMGSRLRPYTDTCPKCLVEVAGKPILGHMIEALEQSGFQKLIVVTGCQAGKVESFLDSWPTPLDIETVHNEVYSSTNNIYSLWLAKNRLHSGFALIESDILLDQKILPKFIHENRIALDLYDPLRHHGTTAEVCCDGYLCNLHIKKSPPAGKMLYKTVNIYSFCDSSRQKLFEKVDQLIRNRQINSFYEVAIKDLLDEQEIKLEMVDFSDIWWDEIDTPEDLERADMNSSKYLAQ